MCARGTLRLACKAGGFQELGVKVKAGSLKGAGEREAIDYHVHPVQTQLWLRLPVAVIINVH
jgi:hypothetical protein